MDAGGGTASRDDATCREIKSSFRSRREADFDAARRRGEVAVPKNDDSWLPMNAL
jgi:hypothetical protein